MDKNKIEKTDAGITLAYLNVASDCIRSAAWNVEDRTIAEELETLRKTLRDIADKITEKTE